MIETEHFEVITGDVVQSRDLPADERERLPERLQKALALLASPLSDLESPLRDARCQVSRGDSFQVVMPAGGAGLRAAIYILGALEHENPASSVLVRLAIGVGPIDYLRVAPSPKRALGDSFLGDGAAFQASGLLLEELKKKRRRLGVRTPLAELDAELRVGCLFLDRVVAGWSRQQAVAVLQRLRGAGQSEIARMEGVTQPAISQRLKSAGMGCVAALIERYRLLVRDMNKYLSLYDDKISRKDDVADSGGPATDDGV